MGFDTETTLDPQDQSLPFGCYRVCRLQGNKYDCIEEEILHAGDLSPTQLVVITRCVRASRSEVVSSDYDERIHVYKRSEFVERMLFDAIKPNRSLSCLTHRGTSRGYRWAIGYRATVDGP
jgi:hypothetical protein